MDIIISISGQSHQTIIFITHTLRKFAVTLLIDINVLLVKKPSLLQMKLERSQFRKLIEEIDREFSKIPKEDMKKSVYVVSDEYKGFIRNPLPSFWSEELSEAYAGVSVNGKKEEETVEEEQIVLPSRIEGGLKIWFKAENMGKVLEKLGGLAKEGVLVFDEKRCYPFDLKRVNKKFHLTRPEFADAISELYDENLIVIDVESCGVPICLEDVVLKVIQKEKEKKDEMKEYAEKVDL